MNYPWYQELSEDDKEIQQGDLIPECPIVIPPAEINHDEEIDVDVLMIDAIVLSQSCDLVNKKVEIVLVCPYYSLKNWIQRLPDGQNKGKGLKKSLDELRKGHFPSYHILNDSEKSEIINDYQVVDFRNVYGIKFELLNSIVNSFDKRLRLMPPYREHLSQAFARYFMRVGLPQDLALKDYKVE